MYHSFEDRRRAFRWHIPDIFNAATDSIDRQCRPGADPDRTALIVPTHDGKSEYYSYSELKRLSDALASALVGLMIEPGTTVCSLLPAGLEACLATLGTLKAGGVIAHIDRNSNAAAQIRMAQLAEPRVLIATPEVLSRARMIAAACTPSPTVICVNSPHADIPDFWQVLNTARQANIHVQTKADDPAVIVFSTGRTGLPKAIVHPHRSVLGHLPAVEMVFESLPQTGDVLWSATAPSHPSGVLTAMLGAWVVGIPILAMEPPTTTAEADACFAEISRHGVRLILMTPRALQTFSAYPDPGSQFNFLLRGIACIGGRPPIGAEHWCKSALDLHLETLYGEAETGPIAATHPFWFPKAGITDIGRAAPGNNINILDRDGQSIPLNGLGHIAVPQSYPGLCLNALGSIRDTSHWARRKYVRSWFLTDDMAQVDEDNRLTFVAKTDDIIPYGNSGFLPDDVELVLEKHHMVTKAAVTYSQAGTAPLEVIAIIQPSETHILGDKAAETMLARDIMAQAATAVAPYALPSSVVFVNDIPTTDEDRIHRAAVRDHLRTHDPIQVTGQHPPHSSPS